MTLFWAKLVWGLGLIGWFAIAIGTRPRSRRTQKLPAITEREIAHD
jgi:hypothetical protein